MINPKTVECPHCAYKLYLNDVAEFRRIISEFFCELCESTCVTNSAGMWFYKRRYSTGRESISWDYGDTPTIKISAEVAAAYRLGGLTAARDMLHSIQLEVIDND